MFGVVQSIRYYFGRGVAFEPVRENTYRLVDPINGTLRAYVIAQQIDYLPTIELQRAYKGNP